MVRNVSSPPGPPWRRKRRPVVPLAVVRAALDVIDDAAREFPLPPVIRALLMEMAVNEIRRAQKAGDGDA